MQGLAELIDNITETLSGVKRDRFKRSAAAYSKEFLDGKRKACQDYAWYAAGVSAAANMIPVPGVGITADISTVLAAMAKIRSDFNLTAARMDKFSNLMPGVSPLITSIVSYATSEGAVLLLKRVGTSAMIAEATKYIPLLGSVAAGGISFAAILVVLRMYIDDCYKIAEEMLKANFPS